LKNGVDRKSLTVDSISLNIDRRPVPVLIY